MMSTLYKINMLSWIFIVLAHWCNSPRVDMLLHSDKLSLFQANQSLPLLINVVCLEATNTNFTVFVLTWAGLKNPQYTCTALMYNHVILVYNNNQILFFLITLFGNFLIDKVLVFLLIILMKSKVFLTYWFSLHKWWIKDPIIFNQNRQFTDINLKPININQRK